VIYHFSTLGQLRDAVNSFIAIMGENAPVGIGYREGDVEFIEGVSSLDYVYINENGKIIGDEANDYKPNGGEWAAARIL